MISDDAFTNRFIWLSGPRMEMIIPDKVTFTLMESLDGATPCSTNDAAIAVSNVYINIPDAAVQLKPLRGTVNVATTVG